MRFTSHVRSDQLAELARLLSRIEPFRDASTLVQATVILDANVVIQDIIWIFRRRKNAAARSTLLELLECSAVKAYAPTYLVHEMESNFHDLQDELGIDPVRAREEWTRYQARITFIDVGGPDTSFAGVTDPKDVPYVKLHRRLDVPIVTDDPHLAQMGATVIRIQLFSPLRAYARQRAVEYQLKVVGVGAVFGTIFATRIAFDAAKATTRTIANLPRPVQVIGALALLAAFIHPTSRKWIFERLGDAARIGGHAAKGMFSAMLSLMNEHNSAQQSAEEGLAAVTALLESAGILPAQVLRDPAQPLPIKRKRRAATKSKRARKVASPQPTP